MSGWFTQRGDPALLPPGLRAEMALKGGADAVLLLPALWAVRDAEHFALAGVSLLDRLGCDAIAFGAETEDLPLMQAVAAVLEAEPESFRAELRGALDKGLPHPAAVARAAGSLMKEAPYEHKMLIILSDVKPLDAAAKIRRDERDVGITYDGIRALTDTAHEVRRLRAEGISVICVFTGDDIDLPSAKMVYGQDFVRIRDFSQFADTVGKLIIDQMKNYS